MYIDVNNNDIFLSNFRTDYTVHEFDENNVDDVIKTINMYIGIFDIENLFEIVKNSKLNKQEISRICGHMSENYKTYLTNLCIRKGR